MPPQPSVTDVLGLFVVVASVLFSERIAATIAPYILMAVAAAVGASFSLARRHKTSRAWAVWYVLRVCGLAVLATGFLAAGASAYWPDLPERTLLAPIALFIGFLGDDAPALARWVLGKLLASIDLFRSKGGTP